MAQTMTEQELFQTARTNYQHLVKICEHLELNGYWEQPQKILKQSIITTLNIYVQSVLLLYTVYAKCLTPQLKLWLCKLTGEDSIRVVDVETNENILKLARKITYSPPILLQLCGVTDRENNTEEACIFLDSILNIILIFACQANSEVRDFTRFIQEYYQHIKVFLNQDTVENKMNARYLFRKLSCERIEESLCLYIETKKREERQKKIKEELRRLDLAEHERRKTYLSDQSGEEIMAEDPFKVVIKDGVVFEQEENVENEQKKNEINHSVDTHDSVLIEISRSKDSLEELEKELSEIILEKDIVFEKSIENIEILNINERIYNPIVKRYARFVNLVWKEQVKRKAKRKEPLILDLKSEEEEAVPDKESIKQGFHSLKKKMEAVKNRELDNLLSELDGLIGLELVKEEINSLINLIKIRKMREQYDMPMMDMTYHMVFTGSAGTGKTTVARLVAKIYKELGILSRGELIETDRSGLVAGYIGQTAIKVKEVVESALGGVLFIDEAYSLTSGNRTEDFGGEVIDTLVKLMEDHRDDLVVIVAGYTKEMKEFLKSNSGLVSRFNKFIEFRDYSDIELLDILDTMAKKAGFQIKAEARQQIGGQLGSMTEQKKKEFGNARGIRNVFEKIVVNQANRLVKAKEPTKEELTLLIEDDVYHVIL